jgi:dinuclear metal center YbgI/SA1388 family protein
MRLEELTAYLDDYLAVREIPDYREAYNGLQVEGSRDIRRIAAAVDACQATIEAAIADHADLLLVHHGLFWGSKAPVTGTYYRRLARLIKNDLALYACHLPLDAHPEVGNNHVLARMLGLTVSGTWGEFERTPLAVWAETETPREELAAKVETALSVSPLVIACGPPVARRVGILTGGGGSYIVQAKRSGLDTLITGEGAHHTYFDAEEQGLNVFYAGHYATETVGVRALGAHLQERFGLEYVFLDHPTGL